MVDIFHKDLLHFLVLLHRAPSAAGIEEFSRSTPDVPDTRTLYRWHRSLADDLVYYPNVSFRSLGLTHVHLFIEEPQPEWLSFPYAIHAEWTLAGPGRPTLYLHCLVPAAHRDDVVALLTELELRGTCTRITSITTRDGWQVLQDLTGDGELLPVPSGALTPSEHDVWDVVERLPLLIPIIFESVEQRRSLPAIWDAIFARLGRRTWEYLPRFARRLPRNGKTYVKDAYSLLNHTGLFRQNVVRYKPLNTVSTPIYLLVHGAHVSAIIEAFAGQAPIVDVHPIGVDEALVRVASTHAGLQHVLSTNDALPRVSAWHFVDVPRNDRDPPRVRFAYEVLFDPSTSEWVLPREQILNQFPSR